MNMRSVLIAGLVIALGLVFGACKGPMGPEGPPGPAGPAGPTGSTGPTGADGNANVTLYIFSGHDFSAQTQKNLEITINQLLANKSMWLVYLVWGSAENALYYLLPGPGYTNYSQYRVYHQILATRTQFRISKHDGPGESYFEIRIIRVEANNIEDRRDSNESFTTDPRTLIPEWLDVRDYRAVVRHFGLE